MLKQQRQRATERMEKHHRAAQTLPAPSTAPHVPLEQEFKSSGKGLNIWREPPSVWTTVYAKELQETPSFWQLVEANLYL